MRVAVIGTGYMGAIAGACFAEAGNEVVCVDQDARRIAALSNGRPAVFEPGLEELLKRNLMRGRLCFTDSVRTAVATTEILFLTIDPPPLDDGAADLRPIHRVCVEIGRALRGVEAAGGALVPRIIVNRSSTPIGTQRKVTRWIRTETAHPFEVVSNPGFLREGGTLRQFLRPDRVIIGTLGAEVFEKLRRLYKPFVQDQASILWMEPALAERALL